MKHFSVAAFLWKVRSVGDMTMFFQNRDRKDVSALKKCPAHFGHVTQSSVENTDLKAY